MSDYTQTDIGAGYNSASSINTENTKIETAVNSKVDKSGSTMTGNLDMNSQRILNLPTPISAKEPVTLDMLSSLVASPTATVFFIDTVGVAVATVGLAVGDVIVTKGYSTGVIGGGTYDVVLTSSVTPNTYNIIIGVADNTNSIVLREELGTVYAPQYGYIADGTTPNQDVVLQFIIDAHGSLLNDSGINIVLGGGSGILSAELLIQYPNVRLIGTGKRNVYLAESAVTQPCRASSISPTTLFAVHNDRNLIRFYRIKGGINTNEAGTFSAEGVNFATLETGLVPTAALGFDASGSFHRDYNLNLCGIFGFTSAFDMYDASGTGVKAFAALKVTDCNINRNGWIARNLDTTQWNGFVFQRNEAGQNSVSSGGGFDIRGQDIIINDGNLLEGQADTIKVSGNFKGTIIEGNYFEANSGDYVISIEETIGSRVGPNFYGSITATHEVKLFGCVSPTVDENVNVHYDGCTNINDLNHVIGIPKDTVALNGGSIMMPFNKVAKHDKRTGGKAVEFFTQIAVEQAFNNIENSGGAIHDTTADGDFTTRNATTTAYNSGDILMAVSIVSYDDLPVIAPRLLLNINAGTDGTSSGTFNNFNKGKLSFKDRTFVLISYAKAINTGNSTVAASVYPYGLGAAGGLTATFTTWIWNLGQDFDTIEPFVCPEMYERANAAPLVGAWNDGDSFKLSKNSYVSGSTTGFVCTTAGTPGTWLATGVIA